MAPAAAAKPLKEEGFAIDGGRITITDPEMFVSDTRKLLRLFWLANERDLDIHPEAFTTVTRSLGLITGKVLQDRHSPDGVRDDTARSLRDTEDLIRRWHGRGRLGYAITPRFAPTSSEAQLRGAGELAARYPDVWIQSHVAENRDEIAWARA